MANNVQHVLNVLEVDEAQAKDALRAVLHTIVLNRAVGAVNPRELAPVSFAALSYVTCGDPDVDHSVEEAIERFCSSLVMVGPDLFRGELVLSFYESRKRASFLGFGAATEEKVYWERWVVPVIVNRGAPQAAQAAEAAVRDILFRILLLAGDLARVPKLRGEQDGAIVYAFELAVPQSQAKGGEGLLGQLLAKGAPSGLRFSL